MQRKFNTSIQSGSNSDSSEIFQFDLPQIGNRKCSPNFGESRNWKIYHIVVRSGLSFLLPFMIMGFCNVGMIRKELKYDNLILNYNLNYINYQRLAVPCPNPC